MSQTRVGNWLKSHGQILLFFFFSFALLAYVQFAGPSITGYDGYYHIKVADLMRQHGLVLDFPWLSLTVLDRENYTDHHWLLHLIQLPFTALFDDLVDAAKWSAVFVAALAFTAFGWLLLRYRMPLPLVWVFILAAASSPFLYRFSMARGQSLALVFQIVAFYFLIKKKPYALGVLAVLFVLAYDGFAILAPLVLFALIAHYVVDRRIEYTLIVATGVGVAIGLLIHPYFPNNINFLWTHIVPKLFANGYGTGVGSEWYPYKTWQWFTESSVAIIAFMGALFFVKLEDLRKDKAQLFWLLAATMYFLLYLKSRRFVEYFPPAAVLALAFVMRERLQAVSLGWLKNHRWSTVGLAAVGVGVLVGYFTVMGDVRSDIRAQFPSNAFHGASEYLKTHSKKGELVFQSDWDDFPRLFFHNTHNLYLLGLDPDFMRLKYPDLFRQWKQITRGRYKKPSIFFKKLNIRYAITEARMKKFNRAMSRDKEFERVYKDKYAVVYKLKEALNDSSFRP